ncbi:MAG: MBL fold metallo-hydrolase [Propionibacteriaceae bacterium]
MDTQRAGATGDLRHLTADVTVRQSEFWNSNAGIVDTGAGVVLVDPGILAADLADLAAAVGGRPVVASYSTHAHWDHLLWATSLGNPPRYASAETCARVTDRAEHLHRTLDHVEGDLAEEDGLGPQWDRDHFFDLQPLPQGPGTIGGVHCDLVPIPGHADGQAALVLPDHGVAFVGDTLCDIEVPGLAEGAGQHSRFLASLDRLHDIVRRVEWIVPGHGSVAERVEAERRLAADRHYLTELPGIIAAAPADESDEALAQRALAELAEGRAEDGVSAHFHLDNVRLLRRGSRTPVTTED